MKRITWARSCATWAALWALIAVKWVRNGVSRLLAAATRVAAGPGPGATAATMLAVSAIAVVAIAAHLPHLMAGASTGPDGSTGPPWQ
jgi:hypothetical protein